MLWMNPPFDVFPQVLDKIQKDQAHAILVVPGWRRRKFFHRAREMALDSVVFPRNTLLFEREGKGARGTHWDTYAFLVCGHHPKCERVHLNQVTGVDSGHPEAESSHDGGEGDIEITPLLCTP